MTTYYSSYICLIIQPPPSLKKDQTSVRQHYLQFKSAWYKGVKWLQAIYLTRAQILTSNHHSIQDNMLAVGWITVLKIVPEGCAYCTECYNAYLKPLMFRFDQSETYISVSWHLNQNKRNIQLWREKEKCCPEKHKVVGTVALVTFTIPALHYCLSNVCICLHLPQSQRPVMEASLNATYPETW